MVSLVSPLKRKVEMLRGDSNPLKGLHPYRKDDSYGPDLPKKREENKPGKGWYLLPIAAVVCLILILIAGLAVNR